MKFILLNILLLGYTLTHAQDVSLSAGYKVADFRWSIGTSPNILSEVKWQSLSGPSADAAVQVKLYRKWYIRAQLSTCFITTGKATDTDYAEDDRRSPVYHARLDSDEGNLLTLGLYGGYMVLPHLAVFAGYTSQAESLFLLDHAKSTNLRCTYDTRWKGISAGLSGDYNLTPRWQLSGTVEYSQLLYQAMADWNLIAAWQHPVSFTQQAQGFAIRTMLTTTFRVSSHLSLLLSAAGHLAETGTGTDQLFLESGTIQTTRFNGAKTLAKQLSTGAVFRF